MNVFLIILAFIILSLYYKCKKDETFMRKMKVLPACALKCLKSISFSLEVCVRKRLFQNSEKLIKKHEGRSEILEKRLIEKEQEISDLSTLVINANSTIVSCQTVVEKNALEIQGLKRDIEARKELNKCFYNVSRTGVAEPFCDEYCQVMDVLDKFEEGIFVCVELSHMQDDFFGSLVLKLILDYLNCRSDEGRRRWLSQYYQLKEASAITGDLKISLMAQSDDHTKLELLRIKIFEELFRRNIGTLFLFAERLRVLSIGYAHAKLERLIRENLKLFRQLDIEVVYLKTLDPLPSYTNFLILEPKEDLDSIPINVVYKVVKYAVNSARLCVLPEKTIIEMKL